MAETSSAKETPPMSHALCISDATFEALQRLAHAWGESPETTVERLISAAETSPFGAAYYSGQHSYELDDWLRHLGVSERELAEADTDLEIETENDADA
jgi:hypothetical protein